MRRLAVAQFTLGCLTALANISGCHRVETSSRSATSSTSALGSADTLTTHAGTNRTAVSEFRVTRRPPAVRRGEAFFGLGERFNRYYTDVDFKPTRTLYVSQNGRGDGKSRATPADVQVALSVLRPGDLVQFAAGSYEGCWDLDKQRSGTWELPVVLRGASEPSGKLTTTIHCCATGSGSCFNLVDSNYVAIDQFELVGGHYGVRVAAGLTTEKHAVGNAVLNSYGHDVLADPFITGGNDWFVIDGNRAERASKDDGHGIYLSNGSDFNIARYNELNDNQRSDFQINADPILTCQQQGVDYVDPRCDGDAKARQGDGVSEYILVENNYFHNGRAQGANFTSVRNSIVRNNIFAFYERHGVSFWQETTNPKLGAADNTICHNLFVGANHRDLLQFIRHSDRNRVRNNVFLGVVATENRVSLNTNIPLLAVSDTASATVFMHNIYIGGMLVRVRDDYELVGLRTAAPTELTLGEFQPAWFAEFPVRAAAAVQGFRPLPNAPWAAVGPLIDNCAVDYDGVMRKAPVALGPWVVTPN